MDSILDYYNTNDLHINKIKNNLDAFFNFILTDYNGEIGSKYIDFNIAITSLLQKKTFAFEHYNKFINTINNNSFPSNSDIITIIDNVNNAEQISNKNHKLCLQLWLYIYH